jgi:DHA3 family macrolide efflux protein-like MFS transporter
MTRELPVRKTLPRNVTNRIWSFLLIWFGQLVSSIGSGLTSFTLGVIVFQRTGSATQFTLVYLFATLPGVLLLPIAGALTDRLDRRRIMIFGNIGAGLSKVVLVILLYTQELQVWHIYLTVIAVTSFNLVMGIAYTVMTTILVPKQHYGRSSGMMQAAQSAAQIIPPVLAGVLLKMIQIQGIILIDVATYLFAIAALLVVRLPQPETTAPQAPAETTESRPVKAPLWREAAYGWTYIRARPGLFGLLIYFAAINFVIGSATVLFTPMVLSFASAEILGTILSISGIGFLLGGILMSIWGGPRSRVHGVLGFGLLFGFCSILAGLRPSPLVIGAGTFGMFFALPVINGCSQAIWQSKTPHDVQGRVFAVRRMIGACTIPLAYLLAGPLADKCFGPLMMSGPLKTTLGPIIGEGRGRGIALMFIVAGILTILAQLGGYLYPRLRRVEDELPDAPEVVFSET